MRTPRHGIVALVWCLSAVGAEPRGGPAGIFRTEVPSEPFNLILGRPTRSSVAVSVLTSNDTEGFIRYRLESESRTSRTETVGFMAGESRVVPLVGLLADAAYRYVFCHRPATSAVFQSSAEHTFRTQRAPGAAFTFTITADSHLDENTDPAVYVKTLRNALADRPDFHIDLGDTFMTGKRRDRPESALPQYLAQRHYFGLLCSSAPLFLVLGNHDGESGRYLDVAARMRTSLFPNPLPDHFYSGSADGNYFAWRWGDALCIVLDPFRCSTRPPRGTEGDGWNLTLGRAQYDWLQGTLEQSTARFTFVFVHHLVGGRDRQGRGGAEAVPFFEWGGRDLDGRDVFADKRPGWPMPIHALLRRHGVTAVFHGHDHFFARQETDGIIYQLVPQPGHPGDGSIGRASEYGYASGQLLPGAGYLRVTVEGAKVSIAYVRTAADEPVISASGGTVSTGSGTYRMLGGSVVDVQGVLSSGKSRARRASRR